MTPSSQWNVFAAVLAAILERYSLKISQLDYRVGINKAVVHRLLQSLEFQGQFPVLSVRDLALLVTKLGLTTDEEHELLAAIMAAGIQAKLTPRV